MKIDDEFFTLSFARTPNISAHHRVKYGWLIKSFNTLQLCNVIPNINIPVGLRLI